jgi:ribosome-binding factor A
MTHHRNARLNEQFKREIARVISVKVRDPRVGRVLITEARVTADSSLVRVFFRSLEEGSGLEEGALLEEGRHLDEALKGLEAAAPFIRRELGKTLRLRRVPELRFMHDTLFDSARRIEKVLKEVLPEGSGGAEEGGEEESKGEEK